jgi:hypothetical protein
MYRTQKVSSMFSSRCVVADFNGGRSIFSGFSYHLLEVEVTLRLTVSQSVCLGAGHPFGANDRVFLFLSFAGKIALLLVLGRPL